MRGTPSPAPFRRLRENDRRSSDRAQPRCQVPVRRGQIMAALPEDTVAHRRGKVLFQKNCTYCHETSTALRDRFDQQGWDAIVLAMTNGFSRNPKPLTPAQKELAAYLTEMRGPGPSPMTPKVF